LRRLTPTADSAWKLRQLPREDRAHAEVPRLSLPLRGIYQSSALSEQ